MQAAIISRLEYCTICLTLSQEPQYSFNYESDYVYILSKSFIDFLFLLGNLVQFPHHSPQGLCMIWPLPTSSTFSQTHLTFVHCTLPAQVVLSSRHTEAFLLHGRTVLSNWGEFSSTCSYDSRWSLLKLRSSTPFSDRGSTEPCM